MSGTTQEALAGLVTPHTTERAEKYWLLSVRESFKPLARTITDRVVTPTYVLEALLYGFGDAKVYGSTGTYIAFGGVPHSKRDRLYGVLTEYLGAPIDGPSIVIAWDVRSY